MVGEMINADYVILAASGATPAEALSKMTKLKLIQHLGQDHQRCPRPRRVNAGFQQRRTDSSTIITVAERVWAFILNYLKRLPSLREHMRSREQVAEPGMTTRASKKSWPSSTIGLLGMGEIARPMSQIAQHWGLPIIVLGIWNTFPIWKRNTKMGCALWNGTRYLGPWNILTTSACASINSRGIVEARK